MQQGRDLRPGRLTARLLILALLLFFFGQALRVAVATSLTVDEGLHIASGYSIWRTGDYRLIEEHPPLVKLWLALPLLSLPDLADPASLPAWQDAAVPTTDSLPLLELAQQLLYPYRPVTRWLVPARAMSALLGTLLLAVIARWSHEKSGSVAALFATALAASDPNLQAHAAVAGTDLGAAALVTLGLWQAARFLREPRLRSALVTGLLLGLALSAKLTAALLGPALALAGLAQLLTTPSQGRKRLVWEGATVVAVAGLTLWATYGFQIGQVPGVPFRMPAAAHAVPILRLLDHSQGGHQAFLLGENSTQGWLGYFPVAFLIKTPLPGLVAIVGGTAIGGWALCQTRHRRGWLSRLLSGPVVFVAVYAITSILSPLNIGYRHLLPLLPLLYMGSGAIVATSARTPVPARVALRAVACVLIVAQAATTLSQSPHLLSYANALVGGARNGWRYLADSNTDWGQAFLALAEYQSEHNVGPVQLSAFIFYDPSMYGVDHTPLTPLGGDTPAVFPSRLAPPAGDYAISATPLDGIPLADPEMYD